MGGCVNKYKAPREDLPIKGSPCEFVIQADSYFDSNNFTVYDSQKAPWLHWEGRNFQDKGGKAALFHSAKQDGEKPLVTLEISEIAFEEVTVTVKDEKEQGWGFVNDACLAVKDKAMYNDRVTKLNWKITRTVKVYTSVSGRDGDPDTVDGELCGELTGTFKGIAKAEKKIQYDERTKTRAVAWVKQAYACEMTYNMQIEGQPVETTISPGLIKKEFESSLYPGQKMTSMEVPWAQSWTCGPFQVEYKKAKGFDKVLIKTQGIMNPFVATSLGFAVSYWMHPARVGELAAEKAMTLLSNRVSWW